MVLRVANGKGRRVSLPSSASTERRPCHARALGGGSLPPLWRCAPDQGRGRPRRATPCDGGYRAVPNRHARRPHRAVRLLRPSARLVYNSCRNRHCPTSQSLARAEWLERHGADLLPVEYFQVVFTVPPTVAEVAAQNKAGPGSVPLLPSGAPRPPSAPVAATHRLRFSTDVMARRTTGKSG